MRFRIVGLVKYSWKTPKAIGLVTKVSSHKEYLLKIHRWLVAKQATLKWLIFLTVAWLWKMHKQKHKNLWSPPWRFKQCLIGKLVWRNKLSLESLMTVYKQTKEGEKSDLFSPSLKWRWLQFALEINYPAVRTWLTWRQVPGVRGSVERRRSPEAIGAASGAVWRGVEDLAICVSWDLQEEEDHIVTLLPERRCDKRLKQTENQTAARCFPLKPLDLGLVPRRGPANEAQPGRPSSPASELDMMLLPRPPSCANLANG